MTIENLATVFGPVILQFNEENENPKTLPQKLMVKKNKFKK